MADKVILAVDGGATKTTLTIRSHKGDCYFEETLTGSNYQAIGRNNVEKVIRQLLNTAYESTKLTNINVAAFAMAGIDTENDLKVVNEIIASCLERCPFTIEKVFVENDVHSTLLGLVGLNQKGALVISGTGAISYACDTDGKIVRTGGWGHRAGDEGSGYWIGRQIVKSVFQFEDGRNNKASILKQLVFEKLAIENAEHLMTWLYRPEYTNAQLASISSVLPEAIDACDEQAIAIARQAAKELSNLAITTLRKVNASEDSFPLFLNGGIFQHQPMILNLFQQYTKQYFPRISFKLCEENPIEYIVQRALHELKNGAV